MTLLTGGQEMALLAGRPEAHSNLGPGGFVNWSLLTLLTGELAD